MDVKKVRAELLNSETGEITGQLYEGDRIVRAESLKKHRNTEDWIIESFYKGHSKEIKKWMDDLDVYEKAFLFSIATYIHYEDCHLQHDNGRDIGTEDLISLSGLGRRKAYEVIDSLITKDILYRGKNSRNRQYFINPWLFAKGNRINKVLRTMFKNYRIRVLNGVKWKDVDVK